MARLRIALLLIVVFMVGSAHAAEQYVDVSSLTPAAIPNDANDDTAAIQAAVNGATNKTIYFPPGVYLVNGVINGAPPAAITLNAENVTLLGYGATISKTSSPGIHLFQDTAAAANGLTVLGLTFDLGVTPTESGCVTCPPSSAFWFVRTENLTFRDCTFRNGREGGLKLYKTQNVVVDSCTFDRFCDNGIQIHTPSTSLDGFTGSREDRDARNIRVVNSRFVNINNFKEGEDNGCGILVAGGSTAMNTADVVIANNHFEKCMRGVWFETFVRHARRVMVVGNTFYMCHAHGVGLVGVATAAVEGNTFEDIGTFNPPGSPGTSEIVAVTASGSAPSFLSSDITITDNVFRETRSTPYFQYGVQVAATQRATVKNTTSDE